MALPIVVGNERWGGGGGDEPRNVRMALSYQWVRNWKFNPTIIGNSSLIP